MPRKLVWAAVLAAFAAVAVGVAALTGGGSRRAEGLVVPVQPAAAYELLKEHGAHHDMFQVVDVRTPGEYAESHLPGATSLDVTAADFRSQVGRLDRGRTYLVYCHSGHRSARATAVMKDLGFSRVYDLQGGLAAWVAAGYPTTA